MATISVCRRYVVGERRRSIRPLNFFLLAYLVFGLLRGGTQLLWVLDTCA